MEKQACRTGERLTLMELRSASCSAVSPDAQQYSPSVVVLRKQGSSASRHVPEEMCTVRVAVGQTTRRRSPDREKGGKGAIP